MTVPLMFLLGFGLGIVVGGFLEWVLLLPYLQRDEGPPPWH